LERGASGVTLHVHHYFEDRVFDILERILQSNLAINRGIEQLMSQISDFAAKVNANFASIKAGIASLDAQIQAFQNSPGTLSAADQAALDAIVASSTALATAANAAVVPPVPPAA